MNDNGDVGNIRTKKALIRKEMLAKRRALPLEEQTELSQRICERFLDSEEYRCAATILLYKAYNNETDTDMIFERAVSDGKTVAYPRSGMSDGEPELSFYVIDKLSDLVEGYKGIKEPDISSSPQPFEGSADVCITPIVAFDAKCHRIGYGKAFYDRYIRINSPKKIIGLAYGVQKADDFETEESDRAVDMVITETGVYKR